MKNKRLIGLVGLALFALTVLACDAGTFVAMLNPPTATPSRTPRPTFTPRPAETDTPEATSTPEATNTPEPSPTPTKRPVATARPPTPKPPTAIPAPQFPVAFTEGYLCPQPNDPIWKITGRVNKTGSNFFLGGYTLGLFGSDGRFLKASEPSADNDNLSKSYGGNCRAAFLFLSNLEIDVSEFRLQVPLIVRIIRSATDHTALSPDHTINFEQPGNYYVQYNASQ